MRRDDPVLRQLSLSYRDGPLADERRPSPGRVRAGDRAPDAPYPGGRIFDALRGPHPTVLAFDAPGVTFPGVPVVHLDTPEAREIYDITDPTLLLVRPDNYIGCAALATDPGAIESYLRRITATPVRVGGDS